MSLRRRQVRATARSCSALTSVPEQEFELAAAAAVVEQDLYEHPFVDLVRKEVKPAAILLEELWGARAVAGATGMVSEDTTMEQLNTQDELITKVRRGVSDNRIPAPPPAFEGDGRRRARLLVVASFSGVCDDHAVGVGHHHHHLVVEAVVMMWRRHVIIVGARGGVGGNTVAAGSAGRLNRLKSAP